MYKRQVRREGPASHTPDAVCEVGLMILKGDEKQVGAFSLDVREVGAYR